MRNNSEPPGLIDWFQGNDAVFPAHEGPPTAYIAANFNNTSGHGHDQQLAADAGRPHVQRPADVLLDANRGAARPLSRPAAGACEHRRHEHERRHDLTERRRLHDASARHQRELPAGWLPGGVDAVHGHDDRCERVADRALRYPLLRRGRRAERRQLELHRSRHGLCGQPTTATATTATTTATSATATSATATTSTASATTTASATATTATTSAATSATASATSGSLPRAAGDRAQARQREAADPQGQLLRRPRPPRSHQAIAPRPRHRPEPEARRRQAPRLPGQPAGRPGLETRNEMPWRLRPPGHSLRAPPVEFSPSGCYESAW